MSETALAENWSREKEEREAKEKREKRKKEETKLLILSFFASFPIILIGYYFLLKNNKEAYIFLGMGILCFIGSAFILIMKFFEDRKRKNNFVFICWSILIALSVSDLIDYDSQRKFIYIFLGIIIYFLPGIIVNAIGGGLDFISTQINELNEKILELENKIDSYQEKEEIEEIFD